MSDTNPQTDLNKNTSEINSHLKTSQFRAFFADQILIWVLLWLYNNFPFYINFLSEIHYGVAARDVLLGMGFLHLFLMWPLYFIDKRAISYGTVLGRVLVRLFLGAKKMLGSNPPGYYEAKEHGYFITKEEKTSLLALLVKVIFVPIIIVFTMGNFQLVQDLLAKIDISTASFSVSYFNDTLFILILRIMFLVDTLCFLVGYLIELDVLGNKIKSVESTWFGWFVALACYPPFNSVTGQYLPSYSNDLAYFWNDNLTALMRVLILILFGIYTWASIALGTKASNLTNRGIISHGPYKYVRHPAYIGKTSVWFLTALPVANFFVMFSTLAVMGLYFLRAFTEERHLLQDPEYVEYCKKVKYRFIPYVI